MSFDDIRYVDEWSDNGEHTRGCRQDPHHEGACEPEATMECTAAANIKGEHIPCDIPAPHPGLAHNNRQHEIIWRGAVTEHPTDDGDVPDTDTEQPKGRMFTASEVRRALAGEVPVNWNAAVTGHPTDEPPTIVEKVRITIDRAIYFEPKGEYLGAQIRSIPFPPIAADKDLWTVGRLGEPDRLVQDHETVSVHAGAGFYTAPRFINAGSGPAGHLVSQPAEDDCTCGSGAAQRGTDWHGVTCPRADVVETDPEKIAEFKRRFPSARPGEARNGR